MKYMAPCSLTDDTDISEEPAASILRTKEGYGGSSVMLISIHQSTQHETLDDNNLVGISRAAFYEDFI
jgi:hypothetical protein